MSGSVGHLTRRDCFWVVEWLADGDEAEAACYAGLVSDLCDTAEASGVTSS